MVGETSNLVSRQRSGDIDARARLQAEMEREFGMPRQPHSNADPVGRRVNELHFAFQAEMNDEFGWHGTTHASLAKEWGLTPDGEAGPSS